MKNKISLIVWIFLGVTSCTESISKSTLSERKPSPAKLMQEADSLQRQQCYWEAIEKYSALLALKAYQAKALDARSICYQAIGKPELEIEDSKSLLYLADISFGRKADLSLHLAESYDWNEAPDSVIKYLHISLENSRQNGNEDGYDKLLYPALADHYIDCKNWVMALQMIDSASDHHTRLIEVALPRARLFSEIGQLDSALYWTTYAIDFGESLPHEKIKCHRLRHQVYEKLGSKTMAQKELKLAKHIEHDMLTHPEIPCNSLSIQLMQSQ
jgi:hypothetical protein